jgi:hypothetical protein
MSRATAKIGVAMSLCAIVLLIISMGSGRTPPLTYVLVLLSFVAVGLNLYFLGKFLRALGLYGRKLATLLVGAAWLLVWAVLSILGLAHGLAECAGGCGSMPPKLFDWLFMLMMAGTGTVFNCLLAYLHSGDPAADDPRT